MAKQPVSSSTGVLDPDGTGQWLVPPWPDGATFRELVRHFLMAYVPRLLSERSAARQLAYFESYRTALATAPTHDLTNAADLRWRDELLDCIACCITQFATKAGYGAV